MRRLGLGTALGLLAGSLPQQRVELRPLEPEPKPEPGTPAADLEAMLRLAQRRGRPVRAVYLTKEQEARVEELRTWTREYERTEGAACPAARGRTGGRGFSAGEQPAEVNHGSEKIQTEEV